MFETPRAFEPPDAPPLHGLVEQMRKCRPGVSRVSDYLPPGASTFVGIHSMSVSFWFEHPGGKPDG
jgi:hypothetical protein